MSPRYLKPCDAAAYLSVSERTLRDMVKSGRIPKPLRLGPQIFRFDREAIDRHLNREPAAASLDEAIAGLR